MALEDPQRGIQLLLQHAGPMTTAQLEKRVHGAEDCLLMMERDRLVERVGDAWRLRE